MLTKKTKKGSRFGEEKLWPTTDLVKNWDKKNQGQCRKIVLKNKK